MDDQDWLAERFEQHRGRLRAVAYRMLGSLSEADDAVQEAWLRFSKADTSDVQNLGGWLTTVVARVSLNMLRSRRQRREDPVGDASPRAAEAAGRPGGLTVPGRAGAPAGPGGPEDEAVLADAVGLAMLVVLDTLTP